jgi:transcriptional regulator with XRE-family HTH domain
MLGIQRFQELVMAEPTGVGAKIAQVRESRSLSQAQLAERSQLAEALVAQIEAGGLVAGLAPLMKIARALGVRLGVLLEGSEQTGPIVTRAADLAKAPRFAGGTRADRPGMDFHAVATGKSERHMEPFLIEAYPDAESQPSSHEGEEFLYVLEGRVEVVYGKESHVLEAGDSIYYDSVVSHQVRALEAPAKLLAVLYAPF